MVTFSFGNVAHLCIVWAFYLGLGLPVSLSWPFVLLVVGTILYLVSLSPQKKVVVATA